MLKEATCSGVGIEVQNCALCQKQMNARVYADKDESKHTYTSTVIPPTSSSQGYTEHTCTSCGHSYKDNFIDKITHLPGDINGDGKVNNLDAARLMQYIAGWDVEYVEAALDVNGDGKVNNLDAARLMQYIAGWDVVIN